MKRSKNRKNVDRSPKSVVESRMSVVVSVRSPCSHHKRNERGRVLSM